LFRTIVKKRKGTLRWEMEARVATIMHPRATDVHRRDSIKKTESIERPAATLEKEIKRISGMSGS
jgi:hypothetical protein